MGNCFTKNNKFLKEQMKDEYYNRKFNMSSIGNYRPYQVFIGDELKISETILGMNSLCNTNIHISVGNNPLRLILFLNDSNCSCSLKEQISSFITQLGIVGLPFFLVHLECT